MIPRHERHPDGGFTLAEVLIVVAILSLLLVMIVPYYGGAHARALLVQCQNRLHTVGVGVQSYLNNHDALPVSQDLANPHTDLLRTMVPNYAPAQAFYCPAEKRSDLVMSDENIAAGNISYYYYCCREPTTNYEASQFLWRAGRNNPKWPRLITATGVEGIGGWQAAPWVMSDRWVSGELPHPFGKKGLNYLRLDGTVKMVTGSPKEEFR